MRHAHVEVFMDKLRNITPRGYESMRYVANHPETNFNVTQEHMPGTRRRSGAGNAHISLGKDS